MLLFSKRAKIKTTKSEHDDELARLKAEVERLTDENKALKVGFEFISLIDLCYICSNNFRPN
jgi:cell division protein FtsB